MFTWGVSFPCPTRNSTATIHRIWCQRNACPTTVSSHMSKLLSLKIKSKKGQSLGGSISPGVRWFSDVQWNDKYNGYWWGRIPNFRSKTRWPDKWGSTLRTCYVRPLFEWRGFSWWSWWHRSRRPSCTDSCSHVPHEASLLPHSSPTKTESVDSRFPMSGFAPSSNIIVREYGVK